MQRLLILLAVLMVSPSALAQPADENCVGLSFKLILDPDTGASPLVAPDEHLAACVREMNRILSDVGSTYVLQQATPPIRVGGPGDPGGPSRFYAVDFLGADNAKEDLESVARAEPARYAWMSNAINIYVNVGTLGGRCSFPSDDEVIVAGAGLDSAGMLHEIGHYFSLCHTQGCRCGVGRGCPGAADPSEGCDGPDDDGVADTLSDFSCWDAEQIAATNFGTWFGALDPGAQTSVNAVLHNVMSYHHLQGVVVDQLTPGQLSRWDFAARLFRGHVVERLKGYVRIGPRESISAAISSLKDGGLLGLLPGSYPERLVISKAVTLQAEQGGSAVIGGR